MEQTMTSIIKNYFANIDQQKLAQYSVKWAVALVVAIVCTAIIFAIIVSDTTVYEKIFPIFMMLAYLLKPDWPKE